MWILRSTATAITALAIAVLYLGFWQHVESNEMDHRVIMVAFVSLIGGTFGILVGVGSMLASFAIEVSGRTFDYRDTLYGRFARWATGDCKSWCGVGGMFAFILFVALVSSVAVGMIGYAALTI